MKSASQTFRIFFLLFLVYICLTAGAKAATFTVSNLDDSGAGSLRQAITDAVNTPDEDIINFQPGLTGTINLESALPPLSNLTINGPGADLLTIRRVGGAIRIFRVTSSTVVLNGLTIAGGIAPNSSTDPETPVGKGGGILVEGFQTRLTVNNCRLNGNSSYGAISEGGGIHNRGFLTVTNSDFTGNSTIFIGIGHEYGSAIYNEGTATIENSTFSANIRGNAAIYNARLMTISGSSITNNNGKGILMQVFSGSPGSLFIENSTISGNSNWGLWQISGALELRSITVTNNQQFGIVAGSSSNQCRLDNSIAAGNSGSDVTGSFAPASSYNLIGNGASTNLVNGQNGNIVGTSAAPINAQLAPLGNYGGRTLTHRLLNTSPAINAGNPLDFSVTDQRGVARPVGGTPDIGAFEFNLTPHRSLPNGGLNANYNQTFTAFAAMTEPVFSFAVTEGALPPGLSLSPTETNAAALTGTPTSVGTFNFTITASNAAGFTISASYTLTIQNAVSFVAIRGRVLNADGRPVSRAFVLVFDANGNVVKQAFTNPFGYYRLNAVQAGETYSFKAVAKNRRFTTQNLTVNGELNDFNFIAEP